MKPHYPYGIDEANGLVHAWFIRMEYRGGPLTSDLEPKLTPFEDRYYDIYRTVGTETFADLLGKLHSNIREFFPLDEVRGSETYLWLEGDELVGSIRIRHDEKNGWHEIGRVMVAPRSQGKGYGTRLLGFAVAKLQQAHRTPIVLTVAAANDGAVRMYERFGFVRVGEELETWKVEAASLG